MALAETELQVREWLDRLAIQDLIYRYSNALTRADWNEFESVFSPDLVWESPALGLRHENRASFVDFIRSSGTDGLLIQTPHAPVIQLAGTDEATATTIIHELVRGSGNEMNIDGYGFYFDDGARIDGDWKFTHRVYVPHYVSQGCVTGDVVIPRSGLVRPH